MSHNYAAVNISESGQLHQGDQYKGNTFATTYNSNVYVSAPAQVPTPVPSAIFTVPYKRDPGFISRNDIFSQIQDVTQDIRPAVLCGLGGTGKSQIAIEYAYRFRNTHPDSYIIWIFAANRETVDQACRECARKLRLTGTDDPKIDPCSTLLQWLGDENTADGAVNKKWMLILDNVDSLSTLHDIPVQQTSDNRAAGTPQKSLLDALPAQRTLEQIILVTSRSHDVAACFDSQGISIDVFSQREGLELLQNRLSKTTSTIDAANREKLVQKLDFLPLAITQAAAYMTRNRLTVEQYLTKLEADDRLIGTYLSLELQDPRRNRGYPNSVYRTWKLSYDEIEKSDPLASLLLSIIAFLGEKQIPRVLFNYLELEGYELQPNPDLDMALGTIFGYSLATTETNLDLISVHVLVSGSIRHWLAEESENDINEAARRALEMMSECTLGQATGDVVEMWSRWTPFVPHARAMLTRCPESLSGCGDRALVMMMLSLYEFAMENHATGLELARCAVTETRDAGLADAKTMLPYSSLTAVMLCNMNQFAEAISILQENLTRWEHDPQADPMSVTSCKKHLVVAMANGGRVQEAEAIAGNLRAEVKANPDVSVESRFRALYISAAVSGYKKDLAAAENYLKQAIELLDPVEASDRLLELRFVLVGVLIRQFKLSDAIDLLRTFVDTYMEKDHSHKFILKLFGFLPLCLMFDHQLEEASMRLNDLLKEERALLSAKDPQVIEHEVDIRCIEAMIADEKINGPLPKLWVMKSRKEEPHDMGFLNFKTKEWTPNDPRTSTAPQANKSNDQADELTMSNGEEPWSVIEQSTIGDNKNSEAQQDVPVEKVVLEDKTIETKLEQSDTNLNTVMASFTETIPLLKRNKLPTAAKAVQAMLRFSAVSRHRTL